MIHVVWFLTKFTNDSEWLDCIMPCPINYSLPGVAGTHIHLNALGPFNNYMDKERERGVSKKSTLLHLGHRGPKRPFNRFSKTFLKCTWYRHSSFNTVFWPGKNSVKGKPCYRRSILLLKPQNGEFDNLKSTFSLVFTNSVKLQLHSLYLYLS